MNLRNKLLNLPYTRPQYKAEDRLYTKSSRVALSRKQTYEQNKIVWGKYKDLKKTLSDIYFDKEESLMFNNKTSIDKLKSARVLKSFFIKQNTIAHKPQKDDLSQPEDNTTINYVGSLGLVGERKNRYNALYKLNKLNNVYPINDYRNNISVKTSENKSHKSLKMTYSKIRFLGTGRKPFTFFATLRNHYNKALPNTVKRTKSKQFHKTISNSSEGELLDTIKSESVLAHRFSRLLTRHTQSYPTKKVRKLFYKHKLVSNKASRYNVKVKFLSLPLEVKNHTARTENFAKRIAKFSPHSVISETLMLSALRKRLFSRTARDLRKLGNTNKQQYSTFCPF